MNKNKEIYSEMVSYVGKKLRDHFGKGPTSIYITLNKPYITIYLRDFLAPMERILVERNEVKRVEETRDLIMVDLLPELSRMLSQIADVNINKLYYNWSLENQSGMIFGVINEQNIIPPSWPSYLNEEAFRQEVIILTKKGQKAPEQTELFWLSERTIVVKRKGIFVRIEKELIKNGYVEELKLTKRPMEKELVAEANLEPLLQKKIQDIFVDWDVDDDVGYIVLVTE
ncbi:Na-translocating system protein MpsC family protein [Jeotgalibacillus soli]|uniref:Na+-translocating membrane potential-generating system MpsC domain-containing protein n=1 Tax=Jeotgalibacillus soli TaxID=889306 RepID=A0A0C2SD03_9BACL|nr:Na-translocating system protein MpsC family protein [Jeotgalibacillus soli]KIL51849.1 hypothetical protein KP78_02190 [Jeotgalibacillus soli]